MSVFELVCVAVLVLATGACMGYLGCIPIVTSAASEGDIALKTVCMGLAFFSLSIYAVFVLYQFAKINHPDRQPDRGLVAGIVLAIAFVTLALSWWPKDLGTSAICLIAAGYMFLMAVCAVAADSDAFRLLNWRLPVRRKPS